MKLFKNQLVKLSQVIYTLDLYSFPACHCQYVGNLKRTERDGSNLHKVCETAFPGKGKKVVDGKLIKKPTSLLVDCMYF